MEGTSVFHQSAVLTTFTLKQDLQDKVGRSVVTAEVLPNRNKKTTSGNDEV